MLAKRVKHVQLPAAASSVPGSSGGRKGGWFCVDYEPELEGRRQKGEPSTPSCYTCGHRTQ